MQLKIKILAIRYCFKFPYFILLTKVKLAIIDNPTVNISQNFKTGIVK